MKLSFVPLSVFADTSFWAEVNRRKLNMWKLSEDPVAVVGTYTNEVCNCAAPLLSLSYDAFNDQPLPDIQSIIPVRGHLIVYNTKEAYDGANREAVIRKYASEIVNVIKKRDWITQPHLLNTFILTAYADLKKFKFYFWNCIPALLYPKNMQTVKQEILDDSLTASIQLCVKNFGYKPFFLTQNGTIDLKDGLSNKNLKPETVDFVCLDPSTIKFVLGWPLRNLIAALAYIRKDWNSIRLVSFRSGHSPLAFRYTISWDPEQDELTNTAVGWERDGKGAAGKMEVDLSNSFDPIRLTEQSVDLNLRLIRWRLIPGLDLARYSDLKCLILGSGTLGCNIARGLLGWGVRNFTFVDNATVSFSNPVRQSLFEYSDSLDGGKPKAEAATNALRRIFPSVNAKSCCMTIPVPGHSVSTSAEKEVQNVVDCLERLVIEHDVVFLVMDSREARWLPSLLCTFHHKFAISVALGFDSYVVVRHGFSQPDKLVESISSDAVVIPGDHLGCYFCCDVTAPGNTTADRTIDQQCTVSRPGVSLQAAGTAVELLASVLQHPEFGYAPARTDDNDDASTLLGATPHQIRCFVSKFQQITPTVQRFTHCLACGQAVNEAYKKERFQFLLRVFNNPKYLEKVSGLQQLGESFNEMSIWAFDDDESVASSVSSA
uniref:Ubiquitin-like modifier-activating enzyme ATG7 n=1 Tax=Syphacia muris TaxID=451379 RepID=A0A0N5A8R7_9BILA